MEHDGELIVRRVIGADGRSRAYVNGQLVPVQSLRELAEFLIEIHGQQEYQHLVKRGAQRELLDEHLPDPALGASVARDLRALSRGAAPSMRRSRPRPRTARRASSCCATSCASSRPRSPRRRPSRSCSPSKSASPGAAGWPRRRAPRSAPLYEDDEASAHDLLAKAPAALRAAADADPKLAQPAQLVAEAAILAREAADSLRRYLDALDIDPARQEEIERKAAALEALARKHRVGLLDLPAQMSRSGAELPRARETREHNLAAVRARARRARPRLLQGRAAPDRGAPHGRRELWRATSPRSCRRSAWRAAGLR